MSRISCPRQGPFKDQDEAVSKARLRKHQPVMRQSVRQTHRLVDGQGPPASSQERPLMPSALVLKAIFLHHASAAVRRFD